MMMKQFEKFGMGSQLSVFLGKNKEEFTREDLINVISEFDIERLTFHYTALDGKMKELKIPISSREHAELILTEGERVDGSSLFKGIVDAGKSDLYVLPLYKSAFLNPFDENSLDFMCRFLTSDGELADYTPDSVLMKASDLLKKNSGLALHALGELEFFLIGDQEVDLFTNESQKAYHQSAPFSKTTHILNEILTTICKVVGNVKYAHNEVGALDDIQSELTELRGKSAEQVEIEFLLAPIEDVGDIISISKWIIRNIAYQYGYSATFVPKLEIGHAGSGMHFHMALMKDGQNIMVAPDGSLSTEARKLIGGLSKYAASLTAFGNMVAAAYLRLVPHQEAPTKVCWSECNRSAMIRVPLGWSNLSDLCMKINPQQTTKIGRKEVRQTVELRSPDGSAFPQFVLAGLALAAEWGMTNGDEALKLAEKHYVSGNIHNGQHDDLPDLPTCCFESADLLIASKDLYLREGIFTEKIIENTAKLLKEEDDKELNAQLRSLPEAEKAIASRRVMHRAIHKH
jgi:glutamine synthetase